MRAPCAAPAAARLRKAPHSPWRSGCVLGAILGSKAAVWLQQPAVFVAGLQSPALLWNGQSIVGALIGGLVGCRDRETHRRRPPLDRRRVRHAAGRRNCDRPHRLLPRRPARRHLRIAVGPAVGDRLRRRRPAPSDATLRHRVRARARGRYSSAGRPALARIPGLRFKWFLAGYLAWRVAIDFLKPVPVAYPLGLSGLQWLALVFLAGYLPDRRRADPETRMTRKARPYLFYDTTSALCTTCLRTVEAKILLSRRGGGHGQVVSRARHRARARQRRRRVLPRVPRALRQGARSAAPVQHAHAVRLSLRLRAVSRSHAALVPVDCRDQRGVQSRVPDLLRRLGPAAHHASQPRRRAPDARRDRRQRGRARRRPDLRRRAHAASGAVRDPGRGLRAPDSPRDAQHQRDPDRARAGVRGRARATLSAPRDLPPVRLARSGAVACAARRRPARGPRGGARAT